LADREWRSSQDRINELEARKTEASAKLLESNNTVTAIRNRAVEADAEMQRREEARRVASELLAGLEAERDRKFEALSKVRLEADDGARRHLEVEEQAAARLSDIARARAELADAVEEIAKTRPAVEAAEVKLRDLDKRCQVSMTHREQLLAKKGRRQQYATVEERNNALSEEVRRKQLNIKQGRRALDECEQKLKKAEERGINASKEAASQRKDLAGFETTLGQQGDAMRSLGEKLDGLAEQTRLLHQERGRATRDLEHLRRDALASQHRLEGTMPRAYRQALQLVMHWAEETGLQDRIRGPLLMHLDVPPTFRGAVESFAGMALFNVLATDDDAAAQAVKLVRSKHQGTIVVTPLNQLSSKEPRFTPMEGVKPLVDVIKCPEWARPAVLQVFGRAVVCRTMELCEEVARKHGLDAITLDGDRVSRRGVVSGGYQDPQRFTRLALAENIKTAGEKVKEAERRFPDLEQQIRGVTEQLDELHGERRRKQDERDTHRAEMQALTEKVQTLEAESAKCTRAMADLKEWRHRMQVMISEAEASVQAKQAEMASKTLSGLSPKEQETLQQLEVEVKNLAASKEATREDCRALRTSLEEREARVESFLRKRLHDLESAAVSGSQDGVLDEAEEAAQSRARLEREHCEASDGALAAARQVETSTTECAQSKAAMEELASEELKAQEQVASASLRVDQLVAEISAQMQKKSEVDSRLQGLAAPAADVERCRDLPKPQLVRDLAEVGKGLQAFQHVNRKAVEQFENFSEELRDLKQRKEEVDLAEESIQEALHRIDAQKESTLLQTLRRVNEHFQEVFSELVPGGAGKLRVVRQSDTDDTNVDPSAATLPEDGDNAANSSCLGELLGVRIEVSFTGQAQSFLSMGQLSGGQKTVVALSLIFGIQRLEPAPFYLLDEVDAALDASYRSALANLVAKTAKSSQVVLTTFRPEVLDKADRCYRVYQQNRASRIDVITAEQAKQVLREQDRLAQAAAA